MTSYQPPPSSLPPKDRPFGLRLSSAPDHAHNYSALTPVSFLVRAALIHPTKLALTHPERGWYLTYEQWAARCLSCELDDLAEAQEELRSTDVELTFFSWLSSQ